MHARAALGEEPPDRRLGPERAQQLDAALAGAQRRGLDALLLDGLAMLEPRAEELRVGRDRLVEVGDGDADVM